MLPEAQAASWRDGRQAGEGRIDVDQERAEMALHRVELGGEVADVADLDLLRLDAGGLEAARAPPRASSPTMCLFSFVQLRAKSVWYPPRT